MPSDRKFGLFMGIILALFAGWSFYRQDMDVAVYAGAAAGVLVLTGLVFPKILHPLNRSWYGLGLLMGKIVNPVVMGVLFFVIITPVALVTRAFGRDPLRIRKADGAETFWVNKESPTDVAESFKHQF